MFSYFQKQKTQDDSEQLFSQAEEDGILIDLHFYEKAKNNVGEGHHKMGDAYYDRSTHKDYQKALIWYRKASEKGYAPGANDVGHIYMMGYGTNINYTLAMENYLKAANLKLPMGMYNVGYMYRYGLEVDVNCPLAIEWLNKAMERENDYAPNFLGLMYLHGFGVNVDYKRAMQLFVKAKEGGSEEAPYNIGIMYESGYGVSIDCLTALEWYTISLEHGYSKAQHAIDSLNKRGYHLTEQVPKEIDESVQERQDKKEKRKLNIKAFKTVMRENEQDKKQLVKRVLVLEDDKRTMNKNIEKHQVESDDLALRIETLGEMVNVLLTGFRQLKKTNAIHCK